MTSPESSANPLPPDPGAASLADEKAEVRRRAKQVLAALSHEEIARLSAELCDHLLAWPALTTARTVMLYAPMRLEADVTPAALAMLARGQRVCVPRMDFPARRLEPVPIESWESDLVPARMGLREPRAELPSLPTSELDVVLVPGVAFDLHGARLGHGAGLYDRFLPRVPVSAAVTGVALGVQVLERVPRDPRHDVVLPWLATEQGVLRIDAAGRGPTA